MRICGIDKYMLLKFRISAVICPRGERHFEQAPRVDRPPKALCQATPGPLPATQGQRYTDLIETTRFKAMVNRQFKINLGNINHSTLKTDDDIRREAQRILPNVILQIGEVVGEEAWNALQTAFKGSIFKASPSSAEKQKFIRESAQEYKRKISFKEKTDLENDIISELRKALGN